MTIPAWTAEFERITAEWRSIRASRTARRIGGWTKTFDQYLADQRELRDRGQWYSGPADLLSVIGRARRETFHCALLAWLMDPGAPHGLGTRFLVEVLKSCLSDVNWDAESLEGTVTECEVVRPNSRADVVLWIGDWTVVFEAKVDHMERDGQCEDLFLDFSTEPNPRFVYLTPRGRKPETATGDAEGAFKPLSFRTIAELLRDVIKTANIDAAQWPGVRTAESYLQTLEVEFP